MSQDKNVDKHADKVADTDPASPDYKPSRVAQAPYSGPNAARVVTQRGDGKGGALPIAEQTGIAPDYPFEGTPPTNDVEPVKEAPKEPGQADRLKNLFTPGGVLKTTDELERDKALEREKREPEKKKEL